MNHPSHCSFSLKLDKQSFLQKFERKILPLRDVNISDHHSTRVFHEATLLIRSFYTVVNGTISTSKWAKIHSKSPLKMSQIWLVYSITYGCLWNLPTVWECDGSVYQTQYCSHDFDTHMVWWVYCDLRSMRHVQCANFLFVVGLGEIASESFLGVQNSRTTYYVRT